MRNSRAPGRGWLTSLGVALSEQDDQYLGCSWWQCWWDTQVETSGWMLGLEPQTCTEETVAIPQTGMNEALGENPVGAEGQRGGKGQRRPRGRRWGGRCQVTEPSGDRWADSAGRMLPSKDTTCSSSSNPKASRAERDLRTALLAHHSEQKQLAPGPSKIPSLLSNIQRWLQEWAHTRITNRALQVAVMSPAPRLPLQALLARRPRPSPALSRRLVPSAWAPPGSGTAICLRRCSP